MILFDAFNALKAGESLEKPEVWKSRQMLGNALTTLLVFIVVLIPAKYGITAEMVPGIVSGIVAFAGVANMYFTKATTTKDVTFNPVTPDSSKGSSGQPKSDPSSTGLGQGGEVGKQVEMPAASTNSDNGGVQSDGDSLQSRAAASILGGK
jgi:hypothetical protein